MLKHAQRNEKASLFLLSSNIYFNEINIHNSLSSKLSR